MNALLEWLTDLYMIVSGLHADDFFGWQNLWDIMGTMSLSE